MPKRIYNAVKYGFTEIKNTGEYRLLDVVIVLETLSAHIRNYRAKKERKDPCYHDPEGEPRYTGKGGVR